MRHFTPTSGIKESSRNVRGFMKENMDVFWQVFKPLAPYFLVLALIDVVMPVLIFEPDPETGERANIGLGGIISGYFMACLVITWHRVVIHGAENFTAVNPFKPSRGELAFMGMGIALFAAFFIVFFAVGALVAVLKLDALFIIFIPLMIAAMWIAYRVLFYFPSKATDGGLSMRQAFALSKGYVWKILATSILAPIKLILLMFLYMFLGFGVLAGLGYSLGAVESDIITTILGFVFAVPVVIYFQPLLTVIGVTVISNFYQHAMQYKGAPQ